MARHITLNGETHTIAEWCRIKCANYRLVRKRIYAGISLEEALRPDDRRLKKLTIAGQTRTVTSWRRKLKLSRAGWDHRRKHPRPDDELLKPVIHLHEAFGRKQTMKAWCVEYNKKRGTVEGRLKQGMSLELALTLSVGANLWKKGKEKCSTI